MNLESWFIVPTASVTEDMKAHCIGGKISRKSLDETQSLLHIRKAVCSSCGSVRDGYDVPSVCKEITDDPDPGDTCDAESSYSAYKPAELAAYDQLDAAATKTAMADSAWEEEL